MCVSDQRTVIPGQELVFYLREDSASVLVTTLAEDVHDDDISVVFHTKLKTGWTATGDEIPSEVRATAQSVVSLWDSR